MAMWPVPLCLSASSSAEMVVLYRRGQSKEMMTGGETHMSSTFSLCCFCEPPWRRDRNLSRSRTCSR